jgi:hypothetical protein
MPGLDEISRHGRTHIAKADESDAGHWDPLCR